VLDALSEPSSAMVKRISELAHDARGS